MKPLKPYANIPSVNVGFPCVSSTAHEWPARSKIGGALPYKRSVCTRRYFVARLSPGYDPGPRHLFLQRGTSLGCPCLCLFRQHPSTFSHLRGSGYPLLINTDFKLSFVEVSLVTKKSWTIAAHHIPSVSLRP